MPLAVTYIGRQTTIPGEKDKKRTEMVRDAGELINAYTQKIHQGRDIEPTRSSLRSSYGSHILRALDTYLRTRTSEEQMLEFGVIQGILILNTTHHHLQFNLDSLVNAEHPDEERLSKFKERLTNALSQDDPRIRVALKRTITEDKERNKFMKQYAPKLLKQI